MVLPFFASFAASAQGQLNSAGLTGYYPFDDGTANDRSFMVGRAASTNLGSWTGTATYKPGAFGGAAVVGDDAGGNFIVANGTDYLFGGNTIFTVLYWINTETDIPSDPAIVAGGGKNYSITDGGNTRGWVSRIAGGDNLRSNVGDGSSQADSDIINLDPDEVWNDGEDHWNFVALVVDRSAQTLTSYVADENVTATNPPPDRAYYRFETIYAP